MRSFIVLAVSATVALAACGSDSSSDDAQLPDADQLVTDAEELGVSPLALAMERTASATAYRMQMSMGMDMSMGALGQTLSFPADPEAPYLFAESDAEGEQHMRIEMGTMMDAMFASSGLGDTSATELMGGDLGMEMWQDDSALLIDVSGFEAIVAQSSGAGDVFPASTFSVDLDRLGEGIGGPEMASAFAGQAAPDPVELLAVLRDQLAASESDGDTFTGTIGFRDYATAFGQDPAAMTGGLDQSLGSFDPDAMLDVLDDVVVDVTVTIEADAVDTVRFDVDMTSMLARLPEMMAALGEEMSPAESDMMASLLEDASFSMTMLLDYDLDPTIDVVVPGGDFPDATDQILDQFGALLEG